MSPRRRSNQSQYGISWSEAIAIFVSITGLISSIVAWLDIVQYGQMGYQNFLWAGVAAFVVLWGIILWLLYKQKNIYLNIWLAVTVIAVVIAGVWWNSNRKAEEERIKAREEKLVVLFANFEDSVGDSYGLRNEIVEKLIADFSSDERILIETIDEVIKPGTESGSPYARELGKDHQADIVIWGWYRPTENPNINIHIENLVPKQLFTLNESIKLQPVTTIVDLESFSFQQQAGQETSALISYLVAIIDYGNEDYKSAIPNFKLALEKIPESPFLLQNKVAINFLLGLSYLNVEAYQSAIKVFDEIIEINPEYRAAYNNRGIAYANLGQYDRAIDEYNQAILIDEQDKLAYNNRGNAYLDLENYKQAIQDYDLVIQIDPAYVLAYSNRGIAYFRWGKYEEAIESSSKAIELDLQNATAYSNRGNAKSGLVDYESAIEDYDKALELDPKDAITYYNRALANSNLGEYEIAIQDYSQAIQINDQLIDAYINRAVVYTILGRYQEAVSDFDQAEKINPQMVEIYVNRGNMYSQTTFYWLAVWEYDKAIQIDPNLSIAYASRGAAYAYLGLYQEALKDTTHAIEIDPTNAKAYNNRGLAYDGLGEFQKAIDDYTQAILLDPQLPEAYINRGSDYLLLGKTVEAKADFAKYKELTGQEVP